MVKYRCMENTKYGRKVFYLILLAIMFLFLFIPRIVIQRETKEIEIIEESPEVLITTEPEIPKILLDVAWCESNQNQEKKGYNYRYKIVDGQKVKYLWSTDIGYWQINDYYHEENAKKLGMDIYTYKGNRDYALLLYNKNGLKDWGASSACWSDIEAWKLKYKQPYYQ